MKKVVLSIAAMLTLGFASQAQVSIIPKVGVSMANMAFSEEDDEEGSRKANAGYMLGVGFNLPVSDGIFSIQPELLYIQKGHKMEASGGGMTFKGKNYMNYLEIPVLAKVSFGGDAVKAYLNAGPSLGYALGGRYKMEVSGGGTSIDRQGKIFFGEEPSNAKDEDEYLSKDDYNRMDLGVQLGGGIGFNMGPGALLLDLRYGLGMSNFMKGDSSNDIKADGKNRVFALSIGYAIPLGN